MFNTKRLRCFIGLLGMLLPWVVFTLSFVFGYGMPDSISATWYLEQCVTPFMVILGAASILLLFYDGYEKSDDIINTIGGIFGLGICLFPCNPDSLEAIAQVEKLFVGTFQLPIQVSGWIHNIFALGFFGILAFNSLFQFTKSSGEMTAKKKARNVIYRVCGIGMVVSIISIPVTFIFDQVIGLVWAIEMVALTFFGISWITKANAIKFLFAD